MNGFSKKQRDLVMGLLCDFYTEYPRTASPTINFLYDLGLPKTIDAEQIIEVLEAMGYVKTTYRATGRPKTISLTDSGKCYFERKMDLTSEKRIEWIRYIITTAIAVLALVVAAISLAAQLGLIQLPAA